MSMSPKEPNAYEKKRAARAERLREKAAALKSEAASVHSSAKAKADLIPFGQPIHVGHYSEGRDRRFRGRIQAEYRKSFELSAKAEEAERRAKAAEKNRAISSDDPEAIQKIEAKIAYIERGIERANNINATIQAARRSRKTGWEPIAIAQLVAQGISQADAEHYTKKDSFGRIGVPSYANQNARGQIAQLRTRIRELQDRDSRPVAASLRFGPAVLIENRDENRVQIVFDERPSKEVASRLRGRGFVWAPSAGAWQRKNTADAQIIAKGILRDLFGAPTPAASSSGKPPAPKALPPASGVPMMLPAPKGPLKISAALKSWLKAPQTVQIEIAQTLARARAASSTAASFPYGRQRLIVAEMHGEWTLVDTDGEPVFYPPKEATAPSPLLLPAASAWSIPSEISAALKSWLEAPEATQKVVARALANARKASTQAASFPYGRRRLFVSMLNGQWTVRDADGEQVSYQPRQRRTPKARSWSTMTDAQYWNTRNREIFKEKISTARASRASDIKQQRATCRTWADEARKGRKGDARRVAVAESRQQCATALAEKERQHAAAIGEILFHRVRPERSSKAKAAPKKSSARERLAERDDAVASELERRKLGHLVPLWNRMKSEPRFSGASADRSIERMLEGVAEDEQRLEQLQADQVAGDDEYACEQAHEQARGGDPLAAQFVAENCDGPRPRRQPRGSAAVRTKTMLGLPNPALAEKEKKQKEPKKKAPGKRAGRSKAQQSLGTTADTAGPQLTIEAAPRRPRKNSDIPF